MISGCCCPVLSTLALPGRLKTREKLLGIVGTGGVSTGGPRPVTHSKVVLFREEETLNRFIEELRLCVDW